MHAERSKLFLVVAAALLFVAPSAWAFNEDAAQATAKENDCFKCHAVSKRKKAPSYEEIAKKYKGKADAAQTIYLHLTGRPVVKLDEGDEKHEAPKTKDRAELDNLIQFILSRAK